MLKVVILFFLQVLMLIDASFGFEMETFEFLNICQVHGFPRIMGVLTHLDSFKNNKTLRKTKKNLKHRFWTEVYQVTVEPGPTITTAVTEMEAWHEIIDNS